MKQSSALCDIPVSCGMTTRPQGKPLGLRLGLLGIIGCLGNIINAVRQVTPWQLYLHVSHVHSSDIATKFWILFNSRSLVLYQVVYSQFDCLRWTFRRDLIRSTKYAVTCCQNVSVETLEL